MRVGLFTARHTGEAIAQTVIASGANVVARHHVADGWWGSAGTTILGTVLGPSIEPEIVVSCLTDHLFTQAEIDSVPGGIWNLHPAPLPRYRGCNSYSHCIIEGGTSYGVTLHRVDAGIDTGPIVEVAQVPVFPTDTARTLHDRSQVVAVGLFAKHWRSIMRGTVKTTPQRSTGASYYTRASLEPYRDLGQIEPHMRDAVRRAMTFPPHPLPLEPTS